MQKFAGISAPIMSKDVEHNKALTDGNALEQQSYSQFPQSFPHRYVNASFCINHNFTRPQSVLCGKRPNGGAWMNSSICHSKASARTVHRRKWRTVTEKEQTFVSFAKMQENFLDKTDTGMLP